MVCKSVGKGGRQADIGCIFGGAEAGRGIGEFVEGLGLPTGLHQQGITEAEIAGLAARWTGDAPIATNPRPVRGAADLEEILRLAL